MTKLFISILLLAIGIISKSSLEASCSTALYPIFDAKEFNIPRNLRTVQKVKAIPSSSNLQNLDGLRASGSGQFSEKTFNEMTKVLPIQFQQLIVLDLRQESHGFINGNPVSWTDGNYNYGNLNKTRFEIESDECLRLRLAMQEKRIIINPSEDPSKIIVDTIKTERELVESVGAIYIRLPVTDHNRPTNDVIDQFIELVKSLPSDQWLHVHCKGGKGRTTTFLTLLDIMKNAHQASLNDILARQQLIGGSNLTNEVRRQVGEKKRAAEARIELIEGFYLYCKQNPDFQLNWSAWIEQKHLALLNSH
jgi:hypothetical protein